MASSIVDRIRKILSKTEEAGCTEAEAATAMALAGRLMAEHNLSMAEVSAGDEDGHAAEPWAEDTAGDDFGKWTLQHSLAWGIVRRFFFVEGYFSTSWTPGRRRSRKAMRFFGKESNVQTAKWAFASLLAAFDRLFDEHRRKTGCPASDRRAFCAGVASGFSAKLIEERQTVQDERDVIRGTSGETALALISVEAETKQAFRERHGKMKTHYSNFSGTKDSGGARQAGYAAGRNLNLARPIGQSSRKGIGNS